MHILYIYILNIKLYKTGKKSHSHKMHTCKAIFYNFHKNFEISSLQHESASSISGFFSIIRAKSRSI